MARNERSCLAAAPRFAWVIALAAAGTASAQDGGGFSAWNIQGLYGTSFDEPFAPARASKATITLENSAGWSKGGSYFFTDVLYSTKNDGNAVEIYSEWYPSASIGKMRGKDISSGIFKDLNLTLGIIAYVEDGQTNGMVNICKPQRGGSSCPGLPVHHDGLEEDLSAHLARAGLPVDEGDRHLRDAEAFLHRAVGGLDLERVALRAERSELDGAEHVGAERLVAAGEVANRQAQDRA